MSYTKPKKVKKKRVVYRKRTRNRKILSLLLVLIFIISFLGGILAIVLFK